MRSFRKLYRQIVVQENAKACVSNRPSSSQAGRQYGCEESGGIGKVKRAFHLHKNRSSVRAQGVDDLQAS
jgi:hypothetical protein